MINIGKFTLKRLGGNLNHHNLLNFMKRNYLSTSHNKNKRSNDKIDLKEEFQEMLNETKISEEEVNKRKRDEEQKTKETLKQANKDWEAKVDNLKKEFEKTRMDEEEDADSELKIKNVKKKIKSAFNTNKSSEEGKEEDKDKSDKNGKSESTINTLNTFSKFLTGFAKVWKLTFPGEENLELLLEKRKLEAKNLKSKIKEATDEEIAEIEASIPEWKRGAVVLVADQPVQETKSFFETAKRNLTSHVKNLKVYQDTQKTLEDSELSLLVKDMKTSYINVKENLKESQNPLFVVSRDLVDRVSFKSPSSQAIIVMRKYDPEFELIYFEKEVNAIFKQLLTAFLKDDLDTIRLVAGEMALAMLTNEIKTRRERKIECKYKELLYIDNAQYHSADVIDEENCILKFRINTQEINCKISQKDGQVVEGNLDLVENVTYLLDITRNPSPVIEEVGHPYLVVGLHRIGVTRQIV